MLDNPKSHTSNDLKTRLNLILFYIVPFVNSWIQIPWASTAAVQLLALRQCEGMHFCHNSLEVFIQTIPH